LGQERDKARKKIIKTAGFGFQQGLYWADSFGNNKYPTENYTLRSLKNRLMPKIKSKRTARE
jgi:hypothetical protein